VVFIVLLQVKKCFRLSIVEDLARRRRRRRRS
jgi:hypothetical protein